MLQTLQLFRVSIIKLRWPSLLSSLMNAMTNKETEKKTQFMPWGLLT